MKKEITTMENIMGTVGELTGLSKQLMYSTNQLAESTKAIYIKLAENDEKLNLVTTAISSIQDKMNHQSNRLDQLELNEEIKSEQEIIIRNTAKKRVFEIIGDNILDYQKYFKTFISKLYTDARKEAGLGSRIATTRKGDYQRVINYIEAWVPKKGCSGLKEEVDNKAAAKREAEALGYTA